VVRHCLRALAQHSVLEALKQLSGIIITTVEHGHRLNTKARRQSDIAPHIFISALVEISTALLRASATISYSLIDAARESSVVNNNVSRLRATDPTIKSDGYDLKGRPAIAAAVSVQARKCAPRSPIFVGVQAHL
jgi:hypothetical protein